MVAFAHRFRERAKKRKVRLKLQTDLNHVYDLFEAEMAKADSWEQQQAVESQRAFECSEFEDQIQRIDSLDLTNRARRCHIDVSDLPPPADAPHHWIQGQHGAWYLHPKSFRELSKAIEIAEHERTKRALERRDFWIKVYTAFVATLAAIAGILAFFRH